MLFLSNNDFFSVILAKGGMGYGQICLENDLSKSILDMDLKIEELFGWLIFYYYICHVGILLKHII